MKPAIRTTVITIASVGIFILSPYPNLPIIPQTKNPTNVGLDVVIILIFYSEFQFIIPVNAGNAHSVSGNKPLGISATGTP